MMKPLAPGALLASLAALPLLAAGVGRLGGEAADAGASTGPADETPGTAPWRLLDNVEGEYVDLVFAPVRSMARGADGRFYALGTQDSTVVVHDPELRPLATWRVAWGPVSLATWTAPRGVDAHPGEGADELRREELLVVCRGTQALLGLDTASGEIVRCLPLPSEPADLLLAPDGRRAFVSCTALDLVVELDLVANEVAHTYEIPGKHPTFLAADGDDVLVAPMLSGNNTMADPGVAVVDAGPARILDLADPDVSMKPLRDEDLYRLRTDTHAVEPVATGLGTILFAHATNPETGVHWVLGTEAHNVTTGEPALRGEFVSNRIALVVPAARDAEAKTLPAPASFVDFDAVDAESGARRLGREQAVAQPIALTFDERGHAFVAGLGSHNVTELDAEGAILREWDVGSLPRALHSEPGRLFVHCWGANRIEVYDTSAPAPRRVATLDLGFDPAPPEVRRGREIFYGGERSLHGNASCNTCHVDGLFDMLAWDLSALPTDDKGPLITQSLRGINGTQPFHWRGERPGLEAFGPAFDSLMGHEPLDAAPGGEFDDFRAYLFSLHNPANPHEDERRVVSDAAAVVPLSADGPPSSAVRGQQLYYENKTITGLTCQDCHSLPAGTSGDVRNVEPAAIPRRSNFKTVSLLGVWRKEQRGGVEMHAFTDGRRQPLPSLGAGFSATGLMFSLRRTTGLQNRLLTPQGTVDVVSYLRQLDSGLAPAVHRAVLLDEAHVEAAARVADYLLPQAQQRNCDLVSFGASTVEGERRSLRWVFERADGLFHCEDSEVAPRELERFVADARTGAGRTLFLGLPVGMGRRFATDFDGDDVPNLDERRRGTDPLVSDLGREADDQRAPGIELLRVTFANTRTAKVQFDTDEPARHEVRLFEAGGDVAVATVRGERLVRNHTAYALELRPGTTYDVFARAIDAAGNEREARLPAAVTTDGWLEPRDVIVAELEPSLEREDGRGRLTVTAELRFKDGSPAHNHVVRASLLRNGTPVGTELVSPVTGDDGLARLSAECEALAPGDVLTFVIEGIRAGPAVVSTWSLPSTPPQARQVSVTY